MKAPFIIIGMHRSGTSLLARALERAGIFMGVVKDHNFEAMHFLSLNQQILWAAGADWLHPQIPGPEHWKHPSPQALHREHFKVNYRLDRWKLQLSAPPWGWKEPRNTFTLPLWLHLFPQARVIHLVRDQEEVVSSLQRRNKRPGEVHTPELESADFCRELRSQYVETARSYQSQLGERYLELDYQDLRQAPGQMCARLEQFTGRAIQTHLEYLRR